MFSTLPRSTCCCRRRHRRRSRSRRFGAFRPTQAPPGCLSVSLTCHQRANVYWETAGQPFTTGTGPPPLKVSFFPRILLHFSVLLKKTSIGVGFEPTIMTTWTSSLPGRRETRSFTSSFQNLLLPTRLKLSLPVGGTIFYGEKKLK